jgi:hypothetical protein
MLGALATFPESLLSSLKGMGELRVKEERFRRGNKGKEKRELG